MDAASAAPDLAPAFSDRDSPRGRRSIVGGEKERAEVLLAVKKGILKRESVCQRDVSKLLIFPTNRHRLGQYFTRRKTC